jgi:hypothetical protein
VQCTGRKRGCDWHGNRPHAHSRVAPSCELIQGRRRIFNSKATPSFAVSAVLWNILCNPQRALTETFADLGLPKDLHE